MSMRFVAFSFSFMMLSSFFACSDDDTNTPQADSAVKADGGSDGLTQDKGSLKPDKTITVDQKPASDQTATPDMSQLPPVDLKPFTLDTAFTAVLRFSDPSTSGAAALGIAQNMLFLFEAGGTPWAGKVSQATIDAKTGKPGSLTTVFNVQPTLTNSGYAGGYLALSPKLYAAVGYTESKTTAGAVYWGDKGIKTPKKVDAAKGNYDVVFLDDKTMLINGMGAGTAQSGQGVYLAVEGKTPRLLIKDLGVASGALVVGQKTFYAGGYFTSGGNQIFGFDLTQIKQAISGNTTLSATTDGNKVYAGNLSDAAAVGDDLVLIKLDASWKYENVSWLQIDNSAWKVKATKALISGGSPASVGKLATMSGGQLGVYFTNGSKKEIAVIKKK